MPKIKIAITKTNKIDAKELLPNPDPKFPKGLTFAKETGSAIMHQSPFSDYNHKICIAMTSLLF